MTSKTISDAITNISTEYIEKAADYTVMKKARKPVWLKWAAMAACLCLIVSGSFLYIQNRNNNAGNGDIAMLFTEAKVIEVYSSQSVLVEVIEENIYNANTEKNLFHVGDIVRADFNEEIALQLMPDDIVIIGRGNTAKVDNLQKPYIAQCNSIRIKAEEDYRNIKVSVENDEGAEKAGLVFVNKVYGEYLSNLPEDNNYRITDYKLLDYSPKETTENSVSGEFTFAVKAVNAFYYAGQYTLSGTDDYEGWLILRKRFTLEHQNTAYWNCTKLDDIEISDDTVLPFQ